MSLPTNAAEIIQSKLKEWFTFRLMCSKRGLCLLGVGHYFPGQEIHLGDLRHAQLMQSSSVSNKGQNLEKEVFHLRTGTRNKTDHNNKQFPNYLDFSLQEAGHDRAV